MNETNCPNCGELILWDEPGVVECQRCGAAINFRISTEGYFESVVSAISRLQAGNDSLMELANRLSSDVTRLAAQRDEAYNSLRIVGERKDNAEYNLAWSESALEAITAERDELKAALEGIAVDCESGMIRTECDPEDGKFLAREIHDARIAKRCRAALSGIKP